MRTLLKLIFLSAICFLISCDFGSGNKPKIELEKLPPITQTGENTFGCLVNGEAFVVTNSYDLVAMYQQGVLFIGGEKDFNNLSSHISILVKDAISQNQIYTLNNNTSSKGEYYIDGCFYTTTPTLTGTLEITHFDTNKYIISGVYEFSTVNEDCDTVRITDGRFDMQYIP